MSKKILIVDDEPYIVHVLTIKLEKSGYIVVTAGDGEEGLDVALAEAPDLIITDYQMPCMNGLDMCRRYRGTTHRTPPVMVITAREFDLQPELLDGTGVSIILPKPFSPREVVATIENLLSGCQTAQPDRMP